MWENLPLLVLEEIFSYLSVRDRYWASMVCRNWSEIFYSPQVWQIWIMKERVLTRRKFNYYLGYQPVLDHYRTQICLHRVGSWFRTLIFYPMTNFFNLFEFINMLNYFAEYFEENPLQYVHTLYFTFACRLEEKATEAEDIIGTGGRLLLTIRRLISNLSGLKDLTLNDLLLDKNEAYGLMDDIINHCSQSLRKLRLINCTRDPCPLMHVGVLFNLTELMLSPQQLSDDVVILLGDTSIRNLHIVQNKYTETAPSISRNSWKECRKSNPRLRVHMRLEAPVEREIIWQDNAPVRSIVYDSTKAQITPISVLTAVECFGKELEIYGHLGLPRFCMRRSFHDRCDSSLVLLCRQCPHLHTLIVRQLVSSATVILLAWTGKKLKRFCIRRNCIIKRSDWPRSPDWSTEFYEWLTKSALSYEAMQTEVSQLLNVPWRPLADKEFKSVSINYLYTGS